MCFFDIAIAKILEDILKVFLLGAKSLRSPPVSLKKAETFHS